MQLVIQLALILTTSCAAYVIATRVVPLNVISLRWALEMLLECIGSAVVFLVFNLTLGMTLILLVRGMTAYFVSLYTLGSPAIVLCSLFQGVVFQIWWRLVHDKAYSREYS